jgi:hypothetical protein
MVLNPALSPCVFLPPERLENIYALVTADHNGLNNGVFYLKVHTSSIDLLTRIIETLSSLLVSPGFLALGLTTTNGNMASKAHLAALWFILQVWARRG